MRGSCLLWKLIITDPTFIKDLLNVDDVVWPALGQGHHTAKKLTEHHEIIACTPANELRRTAIIAIADEILYFISNLGTGSPETISMSTNNKLSCPIWILKARNTLNRSLECTLSLVMHEKIV